MYKCSKCKLEVIIYDEKGGILPKPIRACNCVQEVIVDDKIIIKPAAIIMDMEGTAYGRSQFKN